MSADQTEIHAGAARIWFGVTPPSDGATVDLTAGAPASGTLIGYTDGPTVFVYTPTFNPIVSEQLTAAHDAYLALEAAQITLTMKQLNAANILTAIEQSTSSSAEGTPAGGVNFFGGKVAVTFGMVVVTAAFRDGAGKYLHMALYRALMTGPFSVPFQRDGESMVSLTFVGYADDTRTAGKQIGYTKIED